MAVSADRRTILMVDDDGEDCMLVRDALRETGRDLDLRFLHNGEEVFEYLRGEGEYSQQDVPWPDLTLLDLKMPRKGGRETLAELKADRRLRRIPIVVLTTSSAADDIEVSYDGGVNCYVTKPTTFRDLVRVLDIITRYWFDVVELPPKDPHGRQPD
jgi:two-component system, response regulator